ncbi:MAG: saccharopine dehydrogenase NADP-binding domain-containing protein, partial [Bacteroidota bacterium]
MLQDLSRGPLIQSYEFIVKHAQLAQEVTRADLVISMLPARFHHLPATLCVQFRKPMITASYVSPEVRKLDWDAKKQGVMLLRRDQSPCKCLKTCQFIAFISNSIQ